MVYVLFRVSQTKEINSNATKVSAIHVLPIKIFSILNNFYIYTSHSTISSYISRHLVFAHSFVGFP